MKPERPMPFMPRLQPDADCRLAKSNVGRRRPPRSHRRGRASFGFTLIELMVAMVVSSIVVMGIFAFASIQQATATQHERNVRIQQALEGAMSALSQDVRMAGLGFTRSCTELRVYDALGARLINPGQLASPAGAMLDEVTERAYWVLRDGIQAHWDSSGIDDIVGAGTSSADPGSAADSLDVILAEWNYVGSVGLLTLDTAITAAATEVIAQSSVALDSSNAQHLAQVRQLFPPGSFFLVARTPAGSALPFRADTQGQCMLLQLTGDIQAGATPTTWRLPIASSSGFNSNLAELAVNDTNGDVNGAGKCAAGVTDCDDWRPGELDNIAGNSIVPLGRLRWSRYEIDYTIAQLPYLIRSDIIGFQEGLDPGNLGSGPDYPFCEAGECPAPQLHLPGSESPPLAVAIGPMIEDMQIAVGCDGYTAAAAALASPVMAAPDASGIDFGEVGPAEGVAGANFAVDENSVESAMRARDEWLGNARGEQWAPDCVWYGTGEYNRAGWVALEGESNPPADFRMSPQTLRITLVGSAEGLPFSGGLATATLAALEDRLPMEASAGAVEGMRERLTLTERFTPKNLRWRDSSVR